MSTEPELEEPVDEEPQPVFATLEDWVSGRFLPMYRRTLGGEFRWCAEWWRHAEAISRLTTLWHLWETLRLKPGTGMAEWYGHLDHHLPILLGPRGTFYQCTETEHLEPHQARAVPAPSWWWTGLAALSEVGASLDA
ncbi:DUF4913 domain-containing protein [Microbispora rosea]|uniref:DUF4913 domain-containing protein n=1 Tax=Microbispora rosea TaxID=58117 RepID=UPI0033D6A1C7